MTSKIENVKNIDGVEGILFNQYKILLTILRIQCHFFIRISYKFTAQIFGISQILTQDVSFMCIA